MWINKLWANSCPDVCQIWCNKIYQKTWSAERTVPSWFRAVLLRLCPCVWPNSGEFSLLLPGLNVPYYLQIWLEYRCQSRSLYWMNATPPMESRTWAPARARWTAPTDNNWYVFSLDRWAPVLFLSKANNMYSISNICNLYIQRESQ